MNEKLKKLREKAAAIDAAGAGAKVEVKLKSDDKKEKVIVNEADGEVSGAGVETTKAKTRGMGTARADESAPPAQKFEIDFDAVELTDVDFNDIMKDAAARSMTRTRSRAPNALPVVNVNYDAAENVWHLANDCVYTTDDGWTITAKAGFAFDLASVPRVLWILISSFDLSLIGPLYHDLLYRHGGALSDDLLSPVKNPTHRFSREDADDLLNELMKKSGVTTWKRLAAYRAVRLFSGFAWKD